MSTLFKVTILFVLFLTSALSAQEIPPTITVEGEATVQTPPDQVTVQFSVENRADDMADAREHVDSVMADVFRVVSRMGAAKDDIQTDQFYIYPSNDKRSRFRFRITMSVTLYELDRVSEFIGYLLDNGVDNVRRVTFDLKYPEAARMEALSQATQNARAKAEQVAAALGLKLGQCLFVNRPEVPGEVYVRWAAPDKRTRPDQTVDNLLQEVSGVSAGRGGTVELVAPGLIDVTSSVEITWELVE